MSWLARPASETQITHGGRLWLYVFGACAMIFLLLPSVIVIPMSFSDSQYLEFPPRVWSLRWYEHYFASPEWMQATATSFKVAIMTMLVATPLGVMAAYGLFVSNLRLASLVFMLLVTPIMVPPNPPGTSSRMAPIATAAAHEWSPSDMAWGTRTTYPLLEATQIQPRRSAPMPRVCTVLPSSLDRIRVHSPWFNVEKEVRSGR